MFHCRALIAGCAPHPDAALAIRAKSELHQLAAVFKSHSQSDPEKGSNRHHNTFVQTSINEGGVTDGALQPAAQKAASGTPADADAASGSQQRLEAVCSRRAATALWWHQFRALYWREMLWITRCTEQAFVLRNTLPCCMLFTHDVCVKHSG